MRSVGDITPGDDAPLGEIVAEEGPVSFDATGGDAEAGPSAADEHAPDPEAMLSPDAARAAEASLDGGGETEPDEVDLDATDGPPTPDA